MITFLNKFTGEIHELSDNTPDEIRDAWLALSETIKACERAKDKLKPKVEALLNEHGLYDYGDYKFRQTTVQRQNYDKSVMRDLLDADTFDVLMIPDKTKVDQYLKDNLESLGDTSTKLRSSMIALGEPYSVIRLEKVK